MENKEYVLGNIVEMKKGHPCGANEWEITRIGADIKIKCQGCGNIIMLSRYKFEKSIKEIIQK